MSITQSFFSTKGGKGYLLFSSMLGLIDQKLFMKLVFIFPSFILK